MTHRFPLIGFLSVAFVVSGTLAAERARPAGPRTEGRNTAAFRKLDRDGDGRLSFSEWHRTRRGTEAMPSKALELFRASDLNRNLRLSPYEFARSLGIRISVVTSNSTQGNGGAGSRGATFSMGSAGGSNGTLDLTGGSSLTVNGGATGVTLQMGSSAGGSNGNLDFKGGSSVTRYAVATGATLQIGSSAGGSSSSVNRLAGGSVSVTDLTNGNTQELLTNLTGGYTLASITFSSGSTVAYNGSILAGSGSLNLTGGGTIPGSTLTNLTVGLTQGPITFSSGSIATNTGFTLANSGSLTLTGGSTSPGSTLTNPTSGSTQGPLTISSGSIAINSGLTLATNTGSMTLTGGSTIPGSTLIIRPTFSRYVGLTLEAARQLAETERRASRVINIDGEQQVVTMDWSSTRVNFVLVDGVVTVAIGG